MLRVPSITPRIKQLCGSYPGLPAANPVTHACSRWSLGMARGQWAAGHRARGIVWGVVTALLIVWVLLITCVSMFRAALHAGTTGFFDTLYAMLSGLTFANCYVHWLLFVLVYVGSVIDAALLKPRK